MKQYDMVPYRNDNGTWSCGPVESNTGKYVMFKDIPVDYDKETALSIINNEITVTLYQEYTYATIDAFAIDVYDIDSVGDDTRIGEMFLTLRHTEKDVVLSFVLSGIRGKSSVYRCIYMDKI